MNKTALKNALTKASIFAAPAAGVLTVTAFAEEVPVELPTVAITTEMLKPLLDGIVSNIGVILPIGIGLFAISIGIRIIPGLISRFLRM